MEIIGTINREIYKCVSENIIVDEVVITEERIEHIKERRGASFYEKYSPYFAEIISDPDYIFQDRLNTALMCKSFEEDSGFVNIVLRLVITGDNPEYKNSIITAIKENNKRFAQRLRNNTPLYRKE